MSFLKNLLPSFQRLSLQSSKYLSNLCQYSKNQGNQYFHSYPCSVNGKLLNNFSKSTQQDSKFMSTIIKPTSEFKLPKKGYMGTTLEAARFYKKLLKIHKNGPVIKRKNKKNALGDKPFAKGVVLKTLIKKPKKPNSANRKCVYVRLSTGKEMAAYVPGIGHTLQEHNVVLVKNKRLKDTPGVKITCIRGAYDLGHVVKKKAN